MARYSRARQISHLPNRYPGEWAFILCAKLASSAPAPAPVEQQEIREMGGEKREKREAEAQNHDGLHELLEKVEQGEISTGTHHLHASVTVSLGLYATATGGTQDPMITGDDEEDQSDDDDDDSLDGEDSNSIDSDGKTSIDGDGNDERPTPTSDAARNQTNPTLALPELDGINSDTPRVSSGDRSNAGAIAGGVIGALLAIALLVGLFIFRTRIRQKIISFRGEEGRGSRSRSTYNRMGPTPTPGADPGDKVVITRFDSKPAMSERSGPVSTLFGSKESTTTGDDILAGLPAPAMVRYSTTTSRRESRNAKYVRQSLLLRNGGSGAASPEFYSPTDSSSPPFRNRSQSPPFRTRSRANSDRFPIAIPTSTTTSPVSSLPSTTTSPTLAPSEIDDSFFHALSQPKLPIQAPQPIAVVPAFLIPETPVEPKDSRFSWSTNQTRRTQPAVPSVDTPVIGTGNAGRTNPRASMAESEQRFRGVNSWVSNQRGRLEGSRYHSGGGANGMEGAVGVVRQSQVNLPPQTPTEFRQHPGRKVSYGASGQRIVSEELDRVLNVNNRNSAERMV